MTEGLIDETDFLGFLRVAAAKKIPMPRSFVTTKNRDHALRLGYMFLACENDLSSRFVSKLDGETLELQKWLLFAADKGIKISMLYAERNATLINSLGLTWSGAPDRSLANIQRSAD